MNKDKPIPLSDAAEALVLDKLSLYSQNTLKTLRCCGYKFFAASVCMGTAIKKN